MDRTKEAAEKVRVAAIADIHVNEANAREWAALLREMADNADILIVAGDLTNRGLPREAEALADTLSGIRIPIIGILGNHDLECGHEEEVTRILCDAGMTLLHDEPCEVHGVGFAGVKGFCGGFDRGALAPFGETMIKKFVRESVDEALRLEASLQRLRAEHRIAVLHYAPIRGTVEGEPEEIFPFLGSSRLCDPIDHSGVSAVVHGHAHHGTATGSTPRGIPVYNVALPLLRETSPDRPYVVLEL